QGHVAVLDGASGTLEHVWNSLCSDRPGLLDPASCSESGSAVWGKAGAVIDSTTGNIFVATGNGRWDGRTHWGDAVLSSTRTPPVCSATTRRRTPRHWTRMTRTWARRRRCCWAGA